MTASRSFEVREPADGIASPLLVHVPHSAVAIPQPWREQLVLDDDALDRERLAMTDHFTDALFVDAALSRGGAAFVNQLSRLVFDPERFEDDALEPMAALGMGVVYTRTSDGRPLRSPGFSAAERERILAKLYRPYAKALEEQVTRRLERFGRCLLLDAHSFPSRALPYEDASLDRPDLCLGFVPAHAPEPLIDALERTAQDAGWRVGRNTPFVGSYVPMSRFGKDERVTSVMIEVNRSRYMDEHTRQRSAAFEATRALAAALIDTALRRETSR